MTTSIVGLENLPNVYFRDISIYSLNGDVEGEDTSRIEVTLVAKDVKIDEKFQWADDVLLDAYLNIKVLQSTDKGFTNEVTSGNYTLQSSDYKTSDSYDMESVKTQVKRMRPKDNLESYLVGDNIYEFVYKFSFNVKDTDLSDVTYFACVELNLEMMQTDFSADFSQEQIKYFQGPISSEKVFVDGALQNKTNVFYLPDNQVWSGPVHIHDGQYMAGAFHTSRPHPNLRLAEVNNLMLKDNRDLDFASKNIIDNSERMLIGSPYDTMDEDGNVKRLFSFNIESIFLEKTKYGSVIKQIDYELYLKTIREFKIHKMILTRNFVKKSRTSDLIPSRSKRCLIYSDNNENNIVFSDECNITEVSTENEKYRYFNFIDKRIKSFRYGSYSHSIELSFRDKTKDLLNSLVNSYRDDIASLQRYYNRASKKTNRTKNDNFIGQFLQNEKSLYGLENSENFNSVPWLISPQNYANLNSYVFLLNSDERRKIYNDSYSSINPETGTPSGILTFIENYKQLINSFVKKFGLSNTSRGTFEKRQVPRKTGLDNPSIYVKLGKNYKSVFEPTNNKPGYRIFDTDSESEQTGILTLTREDFENIRVEEKNRFFTGNPSFDSEESKNLDDDEIEPLSDIETYSTAYFSPRKLILGSKKIDLRQTNVINNKLLNDTLSRLTKKRKSKSLFSKSASINKLRSSPRKATSNDKEKSFQNAADYLGEESKFLDLSSEFATEDLELVQKILVREKFLTSKKKRVKRKLSKDFDLTKKDNAIFKLKRASKTSSKKDKKRQLSRKYRNRLRRIPNHFKAMITSRSNNVRTNILLSPTDLLASEEQNNALLIQHFAVKQIQYLHGFVNDKGGNPIFGLPDWRELDFQTFSNNTGKTLICRAIQYVDEILDINIPENLDFELFDKYFIILPDSNNVSPEEQENNLALNTAIQLTSQEQINYDYTTSNPVVQSIKENSIFTELPEPLRDSVAVTTSSRDQTLSSRQRRGRQRRTTTTPSTGGGY